MTFNRQIGADELHGDALYIHTFSCIYMYMHVYMLFCYFVLPVFFLRGLLDWFLEEAEAEVGEAGTATAWPEVSMCRKSLFLYKGEGLLEVVCVCACVCVCVCVCACMCVCEAYTHACLISH